MNDDDDDRLNSTNVEPAKDTARTEMQQLLDESVRLKQKHSTDSNALQRLEVIGARVRVLAQNAPSRTQEQREADIRRRDETDARYDEAIGALRTAINLLKPHASSPVIEKLDAAYFAAHVEWLRVMRM